MVFPDDNVSDCGFLGAVTRRVCPLQRAGEEPSGVLPAGSADVGVLC